MLVYDATVLVCDVMVVGVELIISCCWFVM